MQELFLRGFRLLAANDELAAFDRDVEFFQAKACDSERNAQFLFFGLLDVVRRIAIGCSFGGALEKTLKVLKTEQERTVEIDGTVHIQSPPSSGFGSVRPPQAGGPVGNPGKGRHLLVTMWGAAGPNQGLGKCCQNRRLPCENTLCSFRLCNSRARTLPHPSRPLQVIPLDSKRISRALSGTADQLAANVQSCASESGSNQPPTSAMRASRMSASRTSARLRCSKRWRSSRAAARALNAGNSARATAPNRAACSRSTSSPSKSS